MKVGYLIPAQGDPPAETAAGWSFLSSLKRVDSKRIRLHRLPAAAELRELYDVLWWHADGAIDGASMTPSVIARLTGYLEKGGSLFLTLVPASVVVDLGLETVRPSVVVQQPWTEENWAKNYPDIRGYAPYQGHPVFQGMTGGMYCRVAKAGETFSSCMYDGALPAKGKVVAVERQYIKVIPDRRILIEYTAGKGRVLCAGAHLFFEHPAPRVTPHLHLFARNALQYLTAGRRRTERATYWTFDAAPPRAGARKSARLVVQDPEVRVSDVSPKITRTLATDQSGQAFDLGGRRVVVLGDEQKGIREVWCHPVRGLRNVRTGILSGGTLTWLDRIGGRVDVTPAHVVRHRTGEGWTIQETTFSATELPAGGIHYTLKSGNEVRLVVSGEIDLRLMWPLDEKATGALIYAWDEGLQAMVVSTPSGELASMVATSEQPTATYLGRAAELDVRPEGFHASGEGSSVRFGMMIPLRAERPTVVGFSASGRSEREAELALREVMKRPGQTVSQQEAWLSGVHDGLTTVETSDPDFSEGYRWALSGVDRFFLETPGLGASFVAGFGTTERGWDGGQKVSGRPGYAWYFGRDAVWTALASLAVGDFAKVRSVLEFLRAHQDVTGKVLHELTTSGFAHFDAADATPLYIVLAGRYVRASGHRSFARNIFASVRKAVEFCASTDTDGDGLIENTNVGHGWVEGGFLFPVHTEHYLAACWATALSEASYLAGLAGQTRLARSWGTESGRVGTIVRGEFWDDEQKVFRFAKNADGTFNNERTVLAAVGMYLGHASAEQARANLRPFAGPEFTADWGVRIIPSYHPKFKPTGYHYGSVWPLFTGWAALAEFRHNRPLQGYMHALSTALTHRFHAAGRIEEVLHGEVFEPAGVCPHQAWSESMVLQPLTEGMLGQQADGVSHALTIAPWFPPHWSSMAVHKLRVGNAAVSFSLERGEGTTTITFTLEGRQAVDVSCALRFPLGTQLLSAEVDGKRAVAEATINTYADAPVVRFRLKKSMTVVYAHRSGIGVVPPVTLPKPGDVSQGLRVVDESFDGTWYTLSLAGPAGSTHHLELIHRGGRIAEAVGCEVVETYVGRSKVKLMFGPGSGYVPHELRLRISP